MRCSDWSSDFCSSDRAEHDKASARNAALYSVAIRSVGSDRGGIRGRWCRAGQGNGEPVDKLHARGAAFRTARTPCRKDPDRFPGGSETHSITLATECASADLASAVGDREIGPYSYNAGADKRADRCVDQPSAPCADMARRNDLPKKEKTK